MAMKMIKDLDRAERGADTDRAVNDQGQGNSGWGFSLSGASFVTLEDCQL